MCAHDEASAPPAVHGELSARETQDVRFDGSPGKRIFEYDDDACGWSGFVGHREPDAGQFTWLSKFARVINLLIAIEIDDVDPGPPAGVGLKPVHLTPAMLERSAARMDAILARRPETASG